MKTRQRKGVWTMNERYMAFVLLGFLLLLGGVGSIETGNGSVWLIALQCVAGIACMLFGYLRGRTR